MNEVSRILSSIDDGDPHAAEQLLPIVYAELRQLAAQRLAQEGPGHTLEATALVHEAYLRLVNVDQVQDWVSRGHFFAAAAEAMRRILVDGARRRHAQKRGGGALRLELADLADPKSAPNPTLLALDEALSELDQHDPQAAQFVKLRYFSGLTHQQAADALGISRRVADRIWAVAKAWLFQRIASV